MEKIKYGIRKVASKSLTGGWIVVKYGVRGPEPIAESEYVRICTAEEKSEKTDTESSRAVRASKIDGAAVKVSQLACAIATAWTITKSTAGAKCTAIVSKYGNDCAEAVILKNSAPNPDEKKILARNLARLSREIESEYAYKYTLDNWSRING